jgi:diaminopimelate decarboxylase
MPAGMREGIQLQHIDIGGGVGIRYRDETRRRCSEYARVLLSRIAGRRETLIVEPGRSLVGNAGWLLTRVEYLKHGEAKDFAIVDAAMNDLMRPALYDAWHDILPVIERRGDPRATPSSDPSAKAAISWATTGPSCLMEGDLLAVCSSGAYGMSMSSNYNTRPRAAEIMVDGAKPSEIRRKRASERRLVRG